MKGVKYEVKENGDTLKAVRWEGNKKEEIEISLSNIELMIGMNVLREVGVNGSPTSPGYKNR